MARIVVSSARRRDPIAQPAKEKTMSELKLLEELKQIDTPTITNVWPPIPGMNCA